ncbi:hypothetical protein TWF281_001541 [Arthrobotrys megalospora]
MEIIRTATEPALALASGSELAFVLNVPRFNGPLTAPDISHWLWCCSQAFRNWEKFYNRGMDDETKIGEAGNAIVGAGNTEELYKWWVANAPHLVEGEWEPFQRMLYDEALGKGWELNVLKEYYTASQGVMSPRGFYNKLQTLSAIIGKMEGIDFRSEPFVEKCNLLFRARPGVLEAILKNHVRQLSLLQDAKIEDVLQWLEEYSEPSENSNGIVVANKKRRFDDPLKLPARPFIKPLPVPIFDTHASKVAISARDVKKILYLVGCCPPDYRVFNRGERFHDLLYLPTSPPGLTSKSIPLTSVTLYYHSVEAGTLLSYEMKYDYGSIKGPPTDGSPRPSVSISLSEGEHITACRYTMLPDEVLKSSGETSEVVRDFMIETSKGKTLVIGGPRSTWDTEIKAPNGWAIVGFHGRTESFPIVIDLLGTMELGQMKPITSLGCIFARVP